MTLLANAQSTATLTDHASFKPTQGSYPDHLTQLFPDSLLNEAQREISQWEGYAPTALRSLDKLASACKVSAVTYKDEATRFGLGSFKALGGAYAVFRHIASLLSEQLDKGIELSDLRSGVYAKQAAEFTVATATDGNHGRSVAWGAKLAGCRCRIYIHREVSEPREQAMAELGAEVIRIEGDYDESVRLCAQESSNNGWHVISDTSYDGYTEIPKLVMAGYSLMVEEIFSQQDNLPTHVIIQAGVGGLAASILASFWIRLGADLPKFIIVESQHAGCILASARSGKPTAVHVSEESVMGGLSCGEISQIAWQILSNGATDAVTISDDLVASFMQLAASGQLSDEPFVAGECATPGMIALSAITNNETYRSQFGIDEGSKILLFGCEGATDAEIYQKMMEADV